MAFYLPGSVNSLTMADDVPFLSFYPVVASSLMGVWDISQPWKVEPLSISLWINSSEFYKAFGLLSRPPTALASFMSPQMDYVRQDINQSLKDVLNGCCRKDIQGVTIASLQALLVVPMYIEH